MKSVDSFIESLRDTPEGCLFNPWWQHDDVHDDYNNSAEIRRHQLKFYLTERLGKTAFLLVGEALGYQGGHFSGIAMTSERMLLGHLRKKGITPEQVFTAITPTRTSREDVRADGFSEPTATIVWEHLLAAGINSYSFAIWNALPWHPYNQTKGMLSNRTPLDSEMAAGHKCLLDLIELLKPRKIVAVGEKAAAQLNALNINHSKVRHPANGGAVKFREQFSALL
ncbi:MAG: uracil-DNA glycosylase [Erysipelotrichia bacterium]|nr:uracil-DNA glycosylase [Candidatus Riflebacteria bacterium]NCB37692.1 uracil-DNA glycosylase [Erysipelotrichia bacterium]